MWVMGRQDGESAASYFLLPESSSMIIKPAGLPAVLRAGTGKGAKKRSWFLAQSNPALTLWLQLSFRINKNKRTLTSPRSGVYISGVHKLIFLCVCEKASENILGELQ